MASGDETLPVHDAAAVDTAASTAGAPLAIRVASRADSERLSLAAPATTTNENGRMWKLSLAASATGAPPWRCSPPTRVPLVEPRSWIVHGGPARRIAWRRDSTR